MRKIEIIFQNKSFVVAAKPTLMLSVPSRFADKDPRPVVGLLLQEQLQSKIMPVHRLDEPVSGLLIFALTAEAHRSANLWFEKHLVQKTYLASTRCVSDEVDSRQKQGWGEWRSLLVKGKKRSFEGAHGKESLTRFRFRGEHENKTHLWELQPVTGRPHQLRYEMAKHKIPIDGDELYGSTYKAQFQEGIDLCAFALDFTRCVDARKFGLPDHLILDPFGLKL